MTIRRALLFVSGFLLLPSTSAMAQSYRESAPVPLVKVYQEMVAHALKQENAEILKLLGSIDQVLVEIATKFGIDCKAEIKGAVEKGDEKGVLEALYKLIYYDIRDVFQATKEGLEKGLPLAALKERLKAAYLDYLVISPDARKANFNLDREVRKIFNEVLTARLAEAVSKGEGDILLANFKRIEDNYRNIFGF